MTRHGVLCVLAAWLGLPKQILSVGPPPLWLWGGYLIAQATLDVVDIGGAEWKNNECEVNPSSKDRTNSMITNIIQCDLIIGSDS